MYRMYNPYSNLSKVQGLTQEQADRIIVRLSPADRESLEQGGKIKVGAAAYIWKVS